jgi:hypothetical protein
MHAVTELEAAVDQLHAVPLEDFVAERKRLAKELRGSGDRAAAAELAKLPKPTPPAWALNHLAREEPETVAAWLDAAAELRDATENADKSSAATVRAAIAAHRDATRALLAAVRERTRPNGRELSEPMVDRVRDMLGAATADPELSELLRAGRIVEGAEKDEDEEGELIWGAEMAGPAAKASRSPGARDSSRRATASRGSSGRAAESPDSSGRAAGSSDATTERRAAKEREAREREEAERAELERLVAVAEERLGELRATAEERAGAAAEAEERLEEAQRTLHRSESEAAAAREAADEAADAAEEAERELRTLTAKLSS